MSLGNDAATEAPRLLPAIRSCDGCTLCCKVLEVRALAKPNGVWCKHCKAGTGCGVYETRPQECIDFNCGYLVLPELTPEWKPSLSHLIVTRGASRERMSIHVDPGRPDAWRRQPYYGLMKQWSAKALASRQQVVVMIGPRSILLLPDRDVDMGAVAADEMIVVAEVPGPTGRTDYEPFVIKRDSALGRQIHDGGTARGADLGALRRGRTLPAA